MMDSYIRLILDLRETSTPVTVKAKRGDTGRVLRVKLSDGGYPYPIGEDCYAVFTGRKPDNTVIYNRCILEAGEIVYAFTEQTCAAAGNIPAEIRLYGNDGRLLTSASFVLEVHDTVFHEEDVISTDERNALDALVTETAALKQEIEQKLASGAFRGEPGPPGADGTVVFEELTQQQRDSLKGADGTVAFEELTDQQRLSLKGEPGEPGEPGQPGQPGEPGKSAYAYAVEGGFLGTEEDFGHKLSQEALLTAGGTMKGDVCMDGNALTGIPAPQAEDHAASKAYVDETAEAHTQNRENPHGVTAQQAGARPESWMPTAAEVGAATPEAVDTAKEEAKTYTNAQVKKAAPRNLLDNSDFEIAQAGYGGKHGTAVYAADRWVQNDKTERSYSKTTHNGHGALKCTTDTRIQQNLYLVEGEVYTASAILGNNRLIKTFTANKGGYGTGSLWVNYSNSYGYYQFVIANIPANTVVSEPVLYHGEYTLDTLPEYQPKGYAVELAECRRYYYRYVLHSWSNLPIGRNEGEGTLQFKTPVTCSPMRSTFPTVNLTCAGKLYVEYMDKTTSDAFTVEDIVEKQAALNGYNAKLVLVGVPVLTAWKYGALTTLGHDCYIDFIADL